jgi:peroxiredoxin
MSATPAAKYLRETFDRFRDMEGSLNERLEALSEAGRIASPAFAQAVDRLIAHLKLNGAGQHAPGVGEPMPSFLLPADDGRLVALESLLEKSPVAVTFHRGHWCPFCRINIHALAVAQKVIKKTAQIVAIMPERQQFAAEFKAEAKALFPVLTDIDNGYAMSLNLAIWVGDEMKQMMTGHGRLLPEYQGNDSWTLPIPATFIIGKDGLIKARFLDPDYRRRMAIEDLLAEIRAAN